ncbi:hypothetical protein SAMN05660742_10687 [Propionispira arboris]|uniref:Uncharacterized protein n=1 Tax=Propionispira arboris TaxID=84035 RepID=A0A1H6YEC5_9FIRM|nr:hypothetical protein [Propionispira arboris]SEJ35542.1 hypothetical protein SAMN05660742_10687 [Propionispira arboris]
MEHLSIPKILLQECVERFYQDLDKTYQSQGLKKNNAGLYPAKDFHFSMEYINNQVDHGEDSYLFELAARGRQFDDINKAAEDVMQIIKKMDFSVAEALLFMKFLETLFLTSPVKY